MDSKINRLVCLHSLCAVVNMGFIWLHQLSDLRKVFAFLCTLLTLLLIYQELVAFTITKPTSNFQEENKLEASDIPEVVLCFEPGFDSKVLEKNGYNPDTYYRGSMDQKSFVGWKTMIIGFQQR